MAAKMASIKIEHLRKFLKTKLEILCNTSTGRITAHGSTSAGSGKCHSEYMPFSKPNLQTAFSSMELNTTLATFKTELHAVEQDHRELSELTVFADLQSAMSTVSFMVFSLYYIWTSSTRLVGELLL
jgi:hypothetical protein